jgi:hypothetical protein
MELQCQQAPLRCSGEAATLKAAADTICYGWYRNVTEDRRRQQQDPRQAHCPCASPSLRSVWIQAKCVNWLSTDTPSTSVLRDLNSPWRSEKAVISVGHTKVKSCTHNTMQKHTQCITPVSSEPLLCVHVNAVWLPKGHA